MIFNSLNFAIFFPVVAVVYFIFPIRYRWAWVLLANIVFYYTFTSYYVLLLASVVAVHYLSARFIDDRRETDPAAAKKALAVAVAYPLCALFLFKYFNFFNGTVAAIAKSLHLSYSPAVLELVLPVGISFYTFLGLAYVIEVHRGTIHAERHAGVFSAYMTFFPQILAGPIPRPGQLLPQFREETRFEYERVVFGLRLMAWGFFKKVVIADRVAVIVTEVFSHPRSYSGLYLIMATLFFSIQIYCDFSGYSDIAIGAARVMGFRLMENFRRPYLARSFSEFWRRWHISLSSWFRDYVYIPLGGNRGSAFRRQVNLAVTMLASALWHGANWTFVVWGGLHAFFSIAGLWTAGIRPTIVKAIRLDRVPRVRTAMQIAFTFLCVTFAWIFFRAENIGDAMYIVTHLGDRLGDLTTALVTGDAQTVKALTDVARFNMILGYEKMFYRPEVMILYASLAVLIIVDIAGERAGGRDLIAGRPAGIRWTLYCLLVAAVAFLGLFDATQFLYFKF